jgi:large subunit ribosomal protein L1
MEKKLVLEAVKKARELSKKRNFKQTFDLVFSLKDLDMKKPDNQVDAFVSVPNFRGKPVKICALVGPEMKDAASVCDTVIMVDDFEAYAKDKKKTKVLANDHAFFIAQANIMSKVAQAFGRVLGTRGKMPNPKAGCVFPPKANLKPIYDKLQKTVRLTAKTSLMVQTYAGTEEMSDDEVADNILALRNALVHVLPKEDNNIRKVLLKLSMGASAEVPK